jgi:hypothetical protein
MIPIPKGWSVKYLADGLVLAHPDARDAARLWYRERVRPARRLGAILDEVLAASAGFVVGRVGPPERLVTLEGEHAALVTVSGTQDGAPAQRDVGVVFGDDFYAALGGLCLRPDLDGAMTQLVRDLIVRDQQVLGLRRRPFEYTPPPGWQPLARELAVEWHPPEFPNDRTVLKVHPAYPHAGGSMATTPQAIARMYGDHGIDVQEQQPPRAILNPAGLAGAAHALRVLPRNERVMQKEIVVLHDTRHRYVLELSSCVAERWAEHRATLHAVVDSVIPIGGAARGLEEGAVLDHWLS